MRNLKMVCLIGQIITLEGFVREYLKFCYIFLGKEFGAEKLTNYFFKRPLSFRPCFHLFQKANNCVNQKKFLYRSVMVKFKTGLP